MHPLKEQLRPLIEAEDIEGLTTLLEGWQPRDAFWRQCVASRLTAPSGTVQQKQRLWALLQTEQDTPSPRATLEDADGPDRPATSRGLGAIRNKRSPRASFGRIQSVFRPRHPGGCIPWRLSTRLRPPQPRLCRPQEGS